MFHHGVPFFLPFPVLCSKVVTKHLQVYVFHFTGSSSFSNGKMIQDAYHFDITDVHRNCSVASEVLSSVPRQVSSETPVSPFLSTLNNRKDFSMGNFLILSHTIASAGPLTLSLL